MNVIKKAISFITVFSRVNNWFSIDSLAEKSKSQISLDTRKLFANLLHEKSVILAFKVFNKF